MTARTAKPSAIPMDRLVGAKRPPIGKLELPFDYDAHEAFVEADEAVRQAEAAHSAARRDPEMTNAKRKLDDARTARTAALDQLRPTVRRFLFRAIPLTDFDKLLLDHKPTEEQRERFGPDTAYDAGTFCPALVHRSLVWTGAGTDEWPKGDQIPAHPCYDEADVKALWDATDTTADNGTEPEPGGAGNFGPAELEALFQTALTTCRTRRQVDLGKAATR